VNVDNAGLAFCFLFCMETDRGSDVYLTKREKKRKEKKRNK
jgi:hypothetical protein